MATGSTDDGARDIGGYLGSDGNEWSFARFPAGHMIEVVKITPTGDVIVAPHATTDDLRNAVHVLAELLRDHLAGDVLARNISIDVRF